MKLSDNLEREAKKTFYVRVRERENWIQMRIYWRVSANTVMRLPHQKRRNFYSSGVASSILKRRIEPMLNTGHVSSNL
jgi:hypothetical protein